MIEKTSSTGKPDNQSMTTVATGGTLVRGPGTPHATLLNQPGTDASGRWVQTQPKELGEGDILSLRYRLDRKIGQGGMGEVYRATDLEAEKFDRNKATVAVKLLRADLRAQPAALDALFKEVDRTRTLQQENIINVFAFANDPDYSYMVMEFLNGRPLDRLIAAENALGMPFELAWPIINGMGRALSFAHNKGLIHSDFKPGNVFVTASGAKVLDFGIAREARIADSADKDDDPGLGLTPTYASCEMIEMQPPDNRDDVFAFGIVVYELLSGKHPYQDPSGRRLPCCNARDARLTIKPVPGVTKRQLGALAGALQFDRKRRTATVDEVLVELWAGRLKGRMPRWVYPAVGVALALAIGLGGLMIQRHFGPQDNDEQFIESLVKHGQPMNPNLNPEDLKVLMEQGDTYLAEGTKPFDPGALSENVSSALGAYQSVLSMDPANMDAAKGILAIANAYKAQANFHYERGEYQKADQMAKIAVRIWPDSVDLRRLNKNIRTNLDKDEG